MQPVARQAPIYLFEKHWEMFNLFWPLILMVVGLTFFMVYGAPSHDEINILLFIAGLVFLNVVHNVFTVFIIIFFPEARAWLKTYSPRERLWLFAKWAAIFFALVLIFHEMGSGEGAGPPIFTFVTGFIANFHHTIMQVRGLSSAYNKIIERDGSLADREIQQLRTAEARERWIFNLFLIVSGIGLWFTVQKNDQFRYLISALLFFLLGALLWNSWRIPRGELSTKTPFLARLIFYPLGALHPGFLMAVPFFHGMEYFVLFQKMWRRSEVREVRTLRFIWFVIIPISLGVGVLSVARNYRGFGGQISGAFPDYSAWIVWLGAFSVAFNYLHFYLDREIFRMKNELVRKHIGPLIV